MAMRRDEIVYYGAVTLVAGVVIPAGFIIATLYQRSSTIDAIQTSDAAMSAIVQAMTSVTNSLIFLFVFVAAIALLQFYVIRLLLTDMGFFD
jgi:succinate dehydrogenase/fumarate reductase cytochrome b subunit